MSWRTLHACSISEAALVCGFLDNDRIDTRLTDATGVEIPRQNLTSAVAPVVIDVSDADLGAATEILADALPAKKQPTIEESLERLGSSIRACAMSPFAPWGVVLAPSYLSRVARSADRPREHAWNLAGIVICGMYTAIYVALAVMSAKS